MSSSANIIGITCPRCKGSPSEAALSPKGKGHILGECKRNDAASINALWPDVELHGTNKDLAGKKLQQHYLLLKQLDGLIERGEKLFNGKDITKHMLENAMKRAFKPDGTWHPDVNTTEEDPHSTSAPSKQLPKPHSGTPNDTDLPRSHPDQRRPFMGAKTADQLPPAQSPPLSEPSNNKEMSTEADPRYTPDIESIDPRQAFKDGTSQPADDCIPRKGFATPDGGREVATNHFRLKMKELAVLYEYEILGIADEHTRPKKRVLVELAIKTANVLSAQDDSFATDHQKKIVAWKDLSMFNGQAPAQRDDIVAGFSVLSHEKEGKTRSLSLQLKFVRKIDLTELVSYVQGHRAISRTSRKSWMH